MDKPKCRAHKKDGTPCGRWPVRGSTVCPKHGGSAPQVRKKAAERLLAAADVLMAHLLQIASSAESEAVRLAAIKDALDRAGFAPAQMVKLGLAQDDPFGDLLKEILSDPDLLIEEYHDQRALPAYAEDTHAYPADEDNRGPAIHYIDADDAPRLPDNARTRRRAERAFYGLPDLDDPSEFGVNVGVPATDPTRPPLYVREAMEADGIDWRPPAKRRGTRFMP